MVWMITTSKCTKWRKIAQIFVCFSESPNFTFRNTDQSSFDKVETCIPRLSSILLAELGPKLFYLVF